MPSSSFRCCLPQASTRAHAPSSLDHVAERCRLPPHPRPAFRSARWLCAGAAHHEPPAPTTTPRDYNSQRAAGRWLAQAAVLGGSGKMADVAVGKDKCGEQRLVSLPLSRIRVIMKSSPEVSSINQEALVLTAKATELFVQYLATYSYRHGSGKEKKALTYNDLANTAEESDTFQFLADILPKKILASKYLKMLKEKKEEDEDDEGSDDDEAES
ncbi:chromatin accessibility complex protein 1 isoform X3 [Urocitellus parryii]|nr:chromatin accessibility complex protein 1 isoform X3 [Urocitellus parryii]